MASSTPAANVPETGSISVSSPPKGKGKASVPSSSTRAAETELPKNVDQPYPAFTKTVPSDVVIGNSKYDFIMRSAGHYGIFLPESKKANKATLVTLSCTNIRLGIDNVLKQILERLITKKGHIQIEDIERAAAKHSTQLTNGCMMMLYCRLRAIHRSFPESFDAYIRRPHVPANFIVPAPFALAFQYLGLFRVSSMTQELELLPTVSTPAAANFCLTTGYRWSLPTYQRSVEYAQALGMRFENVDLEEKLGSAWWLLTPESDVNSFVLRCRLPEDNFTDEDAVIRSLWCSGTDGNLHLDIADLSALTMDRGTLLRNPPSDISLTCYNGIAEEPLDVWSVA